MDQDSTHYPQVNVVTVTCNKRQDLAGLMSGRTADRIRRLAPKKDNVEVTIAMDMIQNPMYSQPRSSRNAAAPKLQPISINTTKSELV